MADEVVLLNEKETNSGRITAEPSGEDPQQQTAGDGDSESDSGEGCEARSLAEKAFLRKDEATASDGLREGLADGKEKALQQGFDSGFKQVSLKAYVIHSKLVKILDQLIKPVLVVRIAVAFFGDTWHFKIQAENIL